MTMFLWIVTVVVGGLLLLVAAMRPTRTTMSRYELDRRVDQGDKTAAALVRREGLIGDILSLQKVATALLLVIITLLLVAVLGWILGIIAAVVVALEYGSVARLGFLRHQAAKLYDKIEPHLLQYAERYPSVFRIVRSVTPEVIDYRLESREQLLHLVSQSGDILSHDEKSLIKHGLEFDDREVMSIMTPVSVIDSISKKELLGPLVLDDLHKTGHSRFPVIDGDLNHIVGVLHIRDLLTLDTGKHSTTVEKAMEPRVFYIREDQTLRHALAAFLRTHHHLFVVVNEFRETVGLLSLEDVIEALIGRKIVDEFDTHEDLRTVAARNPRHNNHPPKHTDV
jgi:CBS domain containing-hemolysin-like protein